MKFSPPPICIIRIVDNSALQVITLMIFEREKLIIHPSDEFFTFKIPNLVITRDYTIPPPLYLRS